MKIALCICFSKKNESYHQKVLNNLNKINIPDGYTLSIYLIISDNLTNSKNLIIKILRNTKIKINVLKAIKKNIPSTRNVFLNKIRNKKIKFIGFLDDDCHVNRNWVINMTKFITKYNCDIVGGPQLHEVTDNKYRIFYNFLEPKFRDKQKINWIATNNCFLKKKLLFKKIVNLMKS